MNVQAMMRIDSGRITTFEFYPHLYGVIVLPTIFTVVPHC